MFYHVLLSLLFVVRKTDRPTKSMGSWATFTSTTKQKANKFWDDKNLYKKL